MHNLDGRSNIHLREGDRVVGSHFAEWGTAVHLGASAGIVVVGDLEEDTVDRSWGLDTVVRDNSG